MNIRAFIYRFLIGLCLVATLGALGQESTNINFLNFTNLSLAIPDNNPIGVQNSHTIAGLSGSITEIQVGLNIAGTGDGAFNGDFYVALVNGAGGFAVLLNRAGLQSDNSFGYGDNGFNVTFSDTPAQGIHFYQNFSYSLNANDQLTGIWRPDGENISPFSDPSAFDNAMQNQSAMLSSFVGGNPNDTWTLFVADLSQGGTAQVTSWSLSITTMNFTTVPEPKQTSLIAAGLLLYACFRRRLKLLFFR